MSGIEAKGLRKTYQSNGAAVHALNGVDVHIEPGEFVAVMGPSGSGKSTLLHMLGALDTPDEGSVFINDKEIAGLSRAELALIRRRHVGFVFQFFNLVPVLTVEENVILPAALDGARPSSYRPRLDEMFELFRLEDHRNKLPAQLSGGEQQRVAIARALINQPDVLLADEPTGNLDRSSGSGVMSLLRRLHDDGQTIVLVTHDPAIASYAQRVLFMRDGQLVDEAKVARQGQTGALLKRLVQLES